MPATHVSTLAWLSLCTTIAAAEPNPPPPPAAPTEDTAAAPEAMDPVARTVLATLVTRGGETVRGEIVAVNDRAILVKTGEADAARRVEWSSLPAETVFRLWRQARGETQPKQWVALGRVLRAMPDGRELSESALSVAVLLDAGLADEADAVRQASPPAVAAEAARAGGPPAPGEEQTNWLGAPPLDAAVSQVAATWGHFPAEREPQYIADSKRFASEVELALGMRLTLVETQHFLYFTNVPPEKTYHSPRLLDQMYDKACDLYGLPRGTRLFKGKCPVYMFASREDLQRYTRAFGGPAWAAGFCQQSTNGDVKIVMFQGEDRGYTIQTMLHETAHGVNWRYRAPTFLPPWLEEGIAEWVASNTTGDFKYVKSKRWVGLQKIRETHRLGDQFFGRPEDGSPGLSETWEYGLAYDMVNTLIGKDRQKFVAMINAIKDGVQAEVALAQHYGVTLDEFVAKYGEAVNIRGLTRR